MKVWLDCDSGMYETVSDHQHHGGVEAELSREEWEEYKEAVRLWDKWQKRLRQMREQSDGHHNKP